MRISDWSSDVCSSDLLAQAHAHSRPPEIHDLRLLVHLVTNAVPAKFTHNRVAILFGVPLDCEADGADMRARPKNGRASCRDRVCKYGLILVVAVCLKKTPMTNYRSDILYRHNRHKK